jgi:hypothetical protein
VARAEQLGGGAVFRAPFDVLDAGRVAAIRDPTGAVVSLWRLLRLWDRPRCGRWPADLPGASWRAPARRRRMGCPRVVAGEQHVVVAWPIGRDDRAWVAGAGLVGPRGELRAAGHRTDAVATWGVPLSRTRWNADVNDNHTGGAA